MSARLPGVYWTRASGRLVEGLAKALAQNPVKWREICRWLGLQGRSLRRRGLHGGESGIRTHGTLPGTRALQARAFSRSAISLGTAGRRAQSSVEQSLEGARSEIQRCGARVYEPDLMVERARLAQLIGDDATSQRHLREAQSLFTEMGATGHAERVARELSRDRR